jgi:hypothetical protein
VIVDDEDGCSHAGSLDPRTRSSKAVTHPSAGRRTEL